MCPWLRSRGVRLAAVAALLIAVAAGCATGRARRGGKEAMATQNWDAAVYNYLELVAREPDNPEYRIGLTMARQNASAEHFDTPDYRGNNLGLRLARTTPSYP